MALGKRKLEQPELLVATMSLPRSPGHAFYEKLNRLLAEAGFDEYVETLCRPYYAEGVGRLRSEYVERSFAHVCETGGARRSRLRGLINVFKRYLMYVAGRNLGVIMRALFNMGTPRGLQKGLGACPRALWEWFTRLMRGFETFLEACVVYVGKRPIHNFHDSALRTV